MPWPLSQEYNEAIQTPASSFADPELRNGQPVTNPLMGMPTPRSGNFADVYEFVGASGAKWAVKCFTREIPGLQERYSEISKHLMHIELPFMVDFKYLEKGIRIRGKWDPILKMQWVEGFLLNEFVRNNLDKPALLEGLGQIWVRMAKRLREANMAHADLQHGNVLLVPGRKEGSLAVKLIDYDGMWVPALANMKANEVGHPAYQHPQRLQLSTYSAEVDRLPLLAITCALRSLAVGGKSLWDRYDNGDNLLFREADLKAPDKSALFKELQDRSDLQGRTLVQELHKALRLPLEDTPAIDALLPETKTASVSAGPTTVTPAEPAITSKPSGDFDAAGTPDPKRGEKVQGRGIPLWALVAGGGAAAALVATILGAVVLMGFLLRDDSKNPIVHAKGPPQKDGAQKAKDAKKTNGDEKTDGAKKTDKEPDLDPKKEEPNKEKPKFTVGKATALRIPLNGIGNSSFVDPISFGPDWLGFNGMRDRKDWLAQGAFARLATKSCLAYPPIPVTTYVFETELEILHPEKGLRLCLGDPWSAVHLNAYWNKERKMVGTTLARWRYGGWVWSGGHDISVGQRVVLKWVVIEGRHALFFAQDRFILTAEDAWPADLCLRIWSEDPDSAILHQCSFRPVRVEDLKPFGGIMPQPMLKLNPEETANRIQGITAGLKVEAKAGERFLVETTQTPMSWIPPGEFDMGPAKSDENIRHRVRLTRGFWIGQFEVTQKEFTAVMGYNPSRIQGSPYLPVDWVTWKEARVFCRKLSDAEQKNGRIPDGYAYRLPTEAEWEYACRAGSESDYSLTLNNIWSRERSSRRPHEVGEKPANNWGLFDTHGNAQEWCLDAWYEYPRNAKDVSVDPFHPGRPETSEFIIRGGAWWMGEGECTSFWRERNHSSPAAGYRGFRMVLGPRMD